MKLLNDLWLFIKSYPIAVRVVQELNEIEHAGVVKFQIGYQKIHTTLIREQGFAHEEIVGSLVYLSLALAAWKHAQKS
jgi:hypothetical protein